MAAAGHPGPVRPEPALVRPRPAHLPALPKPLLAPVRHPRRGALVAARVSGGDETGFELFHTQPFFRGPQNSRHDASQVRLLGEGLERAWKGLGVFTK